MIWKVNLLLLCLSIYQVAGSVRILGGQDTQIHRAPYQVSLRYKANATAPYIQRCAGAIYNSHVILTTAMCVQDLVIQRLQVVAGDRDRTGSKGNVYRVQRIVIQDDFDEWFMDNDLALLLLDHELNLKNQGLSGISIAKDQPVAGNLGTIFGWGAKDDSQSSETLQIAQVKIVDVAQCRLSYGQDRITKAMLCAGSYNNNHVIDACQGDAGGALVVNGAAVGLISWGSGCGRPNYPGVYTNLVYLKGWIEQQVAIMKII
ncbi:trypsin eta-like [Drosophila innubila]|uniref:trypsin eta-like n=1 Tax=Drosophila innubila TaxID=198719 RepID=UPI00148B61A4|nr:trypsin eta-like [Drosophila innubila]